MITPDIDLTLEIPPFLLRVRKDITMTEESPTPPPEPSQQPADEAPPSLEPPTIDQLMDVLQKLVSKRDSFDQTIKGVKDQIIVMVQRL